MAARKPFTIGAGLYSIKVQFGRNIASFQAIKHRLAELLLEVELAKSAAYQAAYSMSVGDDAREHASLAKAAAAEAYLHTATECIQLHGGIGFTWENDTHLWFKRAKSSRCCWSPAAHRERMLQTITTGTTTKDRIGYNEYRTNSRGVRSWLAANWDPNLNLIEWRELLTDSGWGAPDGQATIWPRFSAATQAAW